LRENDYMYKAENRATDKRAWNWIMSKWCYRLKTKQRKLTRHFVYSRNNRKIWENLAKYEQNATKLNAYDYKSKNKQ